MATWIDIASDWASNALFARDVDTPFTLEQSRLLQEILKQSFTLFGKQVGERVGEELSAVKTELQQLKLQSAAKIEATSSDASMVATALEATGSARTRCRRNRRKRVKEMHIQNRGVSSSYH